MRNRPANGSLLRYRLVQERDAMKAYLLRAVRAQSDSLLSLPSRIDNVDVVKRKVVLVHAPAIAIHISKRSRSNGAEEKQILTAFQKRRRCQQRRWKLPR